MSLPASFTISSGTLCAVILSRGATLAELRLDTLPRNLVLGFEDPSFHQTIPIYAGAIVGPVANRIAKGEVRLDGNSYQMPRNEAGQTCLHSGPEGLHAREWTVLDQQPHTITLGVRLANGDQGLPGARDITVCYALANNILTLTITARTDQPTPMNIAAHPYWNLDGREDISGHHLMVHSAEYTPTDGANLPTGDVARVVGTAFDFRRLSPLPLDPALDINFCLGHASGRSPRPCAMLKGADGTTLGIATTAPGLQVYAGAHLPRLPHALTGGRDLRPYGAIALEPQFWPDAPHHTNFPQITLCPGTVWKQITTYRLTPPASAP